MLKAVVQQMKLPAKVLFREHACRITILAYDHWHIQTPSQEQWFVTKISRRTRGIYSRYTACSAAVAAREYVELDVSLG